MLRTPRNDATGEFDLANTKLEDLYRRPGFMIRRAHQISVSLFLAETGALGVTNRQYGILFALRHRPGVDQISVARLLGLDRSTTGMVIRKLEQAGLIGRAVGARDRRRASLALTRAGERLLDRLAAPAQRAQARVLAAFTPAERAPFLALLEKLIAKFNGETRVPLEDRKAERPRALSPRAPPSLRLRWTRGRGPAAPQPEARRRVGVRGRLPET